MLPVRSLRNTVARSIRRETAGDPKAGNTQMRTGPNLGPIAVVIGGVALAYWVFTKKEANISDDNPKGKSLKTNEVTQEPGGGASAVKS